MILSANDLRILLTLVQRAPVEVQAIPGIWLSVQRLNEAVKTGHDFALTYPHSEGIEDAQFAEVNGNR